MPIITPSSPSCIPLNLIKSYLVSMKIPINIPWNRIDVPMQPYQSFWNPTKSPWILNSHCLKHALPMVLPILFSFYHLLSHLWGRRNGPPSGLPGGVRATRRRPRRLRRWHQVRGGAGGGGRTARPWPEGTETAAPGEWKNTFFF